MINVLCECGWSGSLDKITILGDEYRKEVVVEGEKHFIILQDRTVKCPKCGASKTATNQIGITSEFVDDTEDEN